MIQLTAALASVSVTLVAMLTYKAVAIMTNISFFDIDLLVTNSASWHITPPLLKNYRLAKLNLFTEKIRPTCELLI